MSKKTELISIVIPCYNEQDVINICHKAVTDVIDTLPYDFEIIYVDDGSRDDTFQHLKSISQDDSRTTAISLSRNFGKETAMTAGIDHATGDALIILDADLQDPPALIPDLIKIWKEEDADVVYGQRVIREGETWFKKFTAKSFYRIINRISHNVEIPFNTGDFRLMNRRTVDAIMQLREKHRFMKGLFTWVGYKQVPLKYNRAPRVAGGTKWSYLKLWQLALEGITGFSTTPLRIASFFGFCISFFSFIFAGFIIVRTLFFGVDVEGWASIMVMVTFLSGIQLLSIGILGEYIGRIFGEVKRRPLYLIDEMYKNENKTSTK